MFNRGVSGSDSVINNIKEIPIHQIDDIDHNPRYKKDNDVYNEKYDDLKEGIFSTKGKYITLEVTENEQVPGCLLYTSPSPRDRTRSRMPSSA